MDLAMILEPNSMFCSLALANISCMNVECDSKFLSIMATTSFVSISLLLPISINIIPLQFTYRLFHCELENVPPPAMFHDQCRRRSLSIQMFELSLGWYLASAIGGFHPARSIRHREAVSGIHQLCYESSQFPPASTTERLFVVVLVNRMFARLFHSQEKRDRHDAVRVMLSRALSPVFQLPETSLNSHQLFFLLRPLPIHQSLSYSKYSILHVHG